MEQQQLQEQAERNADEKNERVTLKNCAPFTDFISKSNNTQAENGKDLDVVMKMSNLMEYSANYSKTSRSLWQCYRDELNNNVGDSE